MNENINAVIKDKDGVKYIYFTNNSIDDSKVFGVVPLNSLINDKIDNFYYYNSYDEKSVIEKIYPALRKKIGITRSEKRIAEIESSIKNDLQSSKIMYIFIVICTGPIFFLSIPYALYAYNKDKNILIDKYNKRFE